METIPELDIELQTVTVAAKVRKLRATWTRELSPVIISWCDADTKFRTGKRPKLSFKTPKGITRRSRNKKKATKK